jgi:hypothetical protein
MTPGTALNDVIEGVPVASIDTVVVAVTGVPPLEALRV